MSQGLSSDDVPSGVVRGDHIPELDGLRGLAIAFVLIWHLFAIGIPYEPGSWSGWIAYLLRWSWSGVDLFFVLSGFLIGGILIDARESPRFFKAFYVRRAFRILPLYACVVVAYALLSTVVPGSPYLQKTGLFDEAWPVLPYALFGQNFWSASTGTWGPDWLSVTWSLAVEEQFYLILPMAIFFLSRRALTVCFICLVVSAPLLRSFVFDAPDEFFWRYMSLPCRLDALGLGVLVAIASRNALFWDAVSRHWRLVYGAFALCVLRIALYLVRGEMSPVGQVLSEFGYSVFAVLYASLLLIVLIRRDSVLAKATRVPALRYLGGISYGVYLLHQIVSRLLRASVLEPGSTAAAYLWLTPVTLAATIGLAHLSWTRFEKAMVARGRRTTF